MRELISLWMMRTAIVLLAAFLSALGAYVYDLFVPFQLNPIARDMILGAMGALVIFAFLDINNLASGDEDDSSGMVA